MLIALRYCVDHYPSNCVPYAKRGLIVPKAASYWTGQSKKTDNDMRIGAAVTTTGRRTLIGKSFQFRKKVWESEPKGSFHLDSGLL